jgi:hypothetical protein
MRLWSKENPPPGWHPDEDTLLMALENELAAGETERVHEHLASCWTCSTRADDLRRGIRAFVEYREKRYLPFVPGPPNEFRNFPWRLRAVEADFKRQAILKQIASAIEARLIRWLVLCPRWTWIGAATLAALVVLFWMWPLSNPPVVSASELLMRAVAFQSSTARVSKADTQWIAHQRVRIRNRAKAVERDFEWTLGTPTEAIAWQRNTDPLHWNAPLTAEGFSRWRDSLPAKRDSVSLSGELIMLDTAESGGTIRSGRLVVRSADYHPVEENFVFADDDEIEVTEIAFEIREREPKIGMHPAAVSLEPAILPPPVLAASPSPSEPTEAELSNIEVRLRYQLFQNRWDIGEDLSISRNANAVILEGIVSSDERAREMRAAFGGLDYVVVGIRSPDEAVAQLPAASLPSDAANKSRQSAPLIMPLLEKALPDSGRRQELVNYSLASSDAALAEAWALRKLAGRYADSELELLEEDSRRLLLEMVQSHVAEIQRRNADLSPLIALFPPTEAVGQDAGTSWRMALQFLFEQAEQQDSQLVYLLSEGTGGVATPSVSDFAASHARLASAAEEIAGDIAANGIEFLNH